MGMLSITQFGGRVPKIFDPRLIPENRAQITQNCRFDHGGVMPLSQDTVINTPSRAGIIESIFLYDDLWLTWNSAAYPVLSPIATDSYRRLYWTETGLPQMATESLIETGGTNYPNASYNLGVPAPVAAPVANLANILAFGQIASITVTPAGVQITGVTNSQSLLNISPDTILLFHSTGFPTIDNQQFAFKNLLDFTLGASLEETFILGVEASAGVAPTGVLSGVFSSIAKSNPAACGMVTPSGLVSGDIILMNVQGMTQLNGITATVTVTSPYAFTLNGIDSTGYGAFTAGTWSLVSRSYTPTAVTISVAGGDSITQANPMVINHNAHGLTTGEVLAFSSMVGMTQLNGVSSTVTVINGNAFSLDNVDSTGFGVFVSGVYDVVPCFSNNINQFSDTNQLDIITTAYVYRFVSAYGEEGPPSPASNDISLYPNDGVALTGIDAAIPAGWVGNITTIEIFRLNTDTSGNEFYQYVAAIPIGQITYTDIVPSSGLGEILNSLLWDPPPANMAGLIATAGGSLAGYVDNTVYMSVPGFPHAWAYQFALEWPVMGLASSGIAVVAFTSAYPYIISGTNPANATVEEANQGRGCVSPLSIVDTLAGEIIYATPEGLSAFAAGMVEDKLLTDALFDLETWQAFNPSTIQGYLWESRYVGFYTTRAGVKAGFIFEWKTGNWIDLDFYATAGERDPITGNLYLMVGNNIVSFSTAASFRNAIHKGKRYSHPPRAYTALKVLATTYPVTLDITYLPSEWNNFTQTTQTIAVQSKSLQRIVPSITDETEIMAYNLAGTVSGIFLTEAIEELPE